MRYLILLFICINLYAQFSSFSPNDDYLVYENNRFQLIYTKNNQPEATYIAKKLPILLDYYAKIYGFELDEKIKIALVSNKIQLANAFSTQIPFNQDIYYNNGSLYINYFSSSSWLDTLLFHELSHNYQLNAKQSISKHLKKVLGNNFMPIFVGPIPVFTMPNILLPNFLLEGNALYNESVFNNGGRMYNGEIKALVNDMINSITLNQIINNTDTFPYGQTAYIIGGYFWQYLVNKYGFKKVNIFFINHSIHYINPLFYNQTFLQMFGNSLYQEINNFLKLHKIKNQFFKKLDFNVIATSKQKIYLSKIDNKIYF